MYEYFKSLAEISCCSQSGVCSIHPVTSALYDILLYEIRGAVFYLVKMKEFGVLDDCACAKCLEALSLF
jgi:hydroxylamine reductase (hybrid-cluster protein)